MSIYHAQLSVGTTATNVLGGVPRGHHSTGIDVSVVVQNDSIFTVYVGGPGVTTSDYGYAIPANGEFAADLTSSDIPYVVASVPTQVRVIYLGL